MRDQTKVSIEYPHMSFRRSIFVPYGHKLIGIALSKQQGGRTNYFRSLKLPYQKLISYSGAFVDYTNRPKPIFMTAAYICVLATLICSFFMYEDVLGTVMLVTKSCAAFIRISTLKILVSWYPREIIGVVSSALQVR